MVVRFAPDGSAEIEGRGQIRRLLKDLSKEHPPELYAMVLETLRTIIRSENMDALKASGYSERLPYTEVPIHVLKIPPRKRPQGVARIYYGYVEGEKNSIMLLSGEKKHQDPKDDPDKIKAAERMYKVLCKPKKARK